MWKPIIPEFIKTPKFFITSYQLKIILLNLCIMCSIKKVFFSIKSQRDRRNYYLLFKIYNWNKPCILLTFVTLYLWSPPKNLVYRVQQLVEFFSNIFITFTFRFSIISTSYSFCFSSNGNFSFCFYYLFFKRYTLQKVPSVRNLNFYFVKFAFPRLTNLKFL